MRKFKYILILPFLLFYIISVGQLPLQFGDAVTTHSPFSGGIVVRTIKTSNTSTAPLGTNWNTASMTPVGTKPANWNATNWKSATLGNVFGLALDQNSNPNIYVSSTQVYGGGINQNRKIWRLDGTSGANSLVFDFNNPSGIGNVVSAKSLGNVKYSKFGAVENMYASDFNTGEIHRLTGNSSTALLWAISSSFAPKFGGSLVNTNWVPYGIAVRKVSGSSKLFYAKMNITAMNSTFEIWSVDLNPVGDFIPGSELQQFLPIIAGNPRTPIADLAFTEDGKKLLIGQQTWTNFTGSLGAHQSMVIELENIPLNSNTWVSSGNNFPSGFSAKNCVGGVSYSNNALRTASTFGCDLSVYFTADAINFSPDVYGLQGMVSTGGTLTNSIWIDEDDNLSFQDKAKLGDVEIYKNPNACSSCKCGEWESISLGDNGSWWTNSSAPAAPLPSLSFNQGTSTGVLFPHYNCEGKCKANFTYNLINANGTSQALTGNTSLDLGQGAIKNLPCGNYFIMISPTCGDLKCPPIRIPLVIVCPPPCLDCKGNASVTAHGNPIYQNGMVSGNFAINNSNPVSEVRFMVEEFRLISSNGNENCILCKNTPKTWGSIQSAALSSISPSFSNAITIDNREAVFNNGGILSMPGNLAFSLALPQTTGLECCKVKAEICVKIIIRDVNCCEKEILKCFTVDLN